MAFEDLFGEKKVISPEAEIIDPSDTTVPDEKGFSFEALFSDPNFVRMLGEMGSAVGGKGSAGDILGTAGSTLARREQVQKGARAARQKGDGQEKSVNDQLMEFLFEKGLLGSEEDNNTNDWLKVHANGSMTSGMKNVPQKANFSEQQPLESLRRPSTGGDDLPDFSNQPSGSSFDFAGLDSEDIGMLLNAEQQFGQLSQNQMKILLNEKARRSEAFTQNKIRAENLNQLGKDRTAKIEAKRLETKEKKTIAKTLSESKLALENRKATLRAKADELTPNELAIEELEMRKLEQEVENLELGEGGTTPIQQANINRMKADVTRKEAELGLKLDDLEKDEIFSVAPSFVDDKGNEVEVLFEEREANATQANNRGNNKVFYHIKQPVVTKFFDGKADEDGNVTPVFLPKHPATGKQITSKDVIDTARANNISPEEVLKQWGLIK